MGDLGGGISGYIKLQQFAIVSRCKIKNLSAIDFKVIHTHILIFKLQPEKNLPTHSIFFSIFSSNILKNTFIIIFIIIITNLVMICISQLPTSTGVGGNPTNCVNVVL